MKKGIFTQMVMVVVVLLLFFASTKGEQTRRIDLNTATLCELDSLPGIGSSMAERILEFRRKNGPFKRIEDLMNVRGIGEKKFRRMRDRIRVNARSPADPPQP